MTTASYDPYKDRLTEAQSKLSEETESLKNEVNKVADRVDPIDTIIRNIKRVRGQRL